MLVWRRRVRKHYISVGTTFSFMRMADIRVMRSESQLPARTCISNHRASTANNGSASGWIGSPLSRARRSGKGLPVWGGAWSIRL